MDRLTAIGFAHAGQWVLDSDKIDFDLSDTVGEKSNILYAFACEDQVMYVGKTTQKLSVRMGNYRNNDGSTNVNVRAEIKSVLKDGKSVEIYVFVGSELLHYGQFRISIAAGLEDSIIELLQPAWNKKR
jgi:hypothetical protein